MLKFHFSKTPKNLPQKPAVSASKENTILFEEGANMRAMLVCRQRMFFAILGFLLIYAVLIFRVFDLCLRLCKSTRMPLCPLRGRILLTEMARF